MTLGASFRSSVLKNEQNAKSVFVGLFLDGINAYLLSKTTMQKVVLSNMTDVTTISPLKRPVSSGVTDGYYAYLGTRDRGVIKVRLSDMLKLGVYDMGIVGISDDTTFPQDIPGYVPPGC